MGKANKKTGKNRLDVWYKKAKEQGYRARSAFKLIHLNRKYDLLSKSKVVIDLCAAPGGWLQVAEKYMPKGSLIVGVDLDPIKPIPNVISFVSDITTPQCRSILRSHLKHFEADLVLHDGAPNVGTAWVQDAFTQSELVLQSLKLAVDFLKKGGSFVTKVFRSGDYNSLMWVFGQLFGNVEATKPPSSRNVSAEIFVVCQDFRKPKYIDPKFLDPKHVFKELASSSASLPKSITALPSDSASSTLGASTTVTKPGATHAERATNIFAPEKKKRQREGYAEGDYTLYRELPVSDFILAPSVTEAITILSTCNRLTFPSKSTPSTSTSPPPELKWLESHHTDQEVKNNLSDLKVLGKSDFKRLIKWRTAIRLEEGLEVKKKDLEEATEKVDIQDEEIDEEQVVTEEMSRLHAEALGKAKKLRRRLNEKKTKIIQRLQLNMTVPQDLILNNDEALQGESDIFDLDAGEKEVRRRGLKSKGRGLDEIIGSTQGMDDFEEEEEEMPEVGEEEDEVLSSEDEREAKVAILEGELDGLYDEYRERMNERDTKWKVKQARLSDKNRHAWHGIKDGSDAEDDGVVKVQGYGAEQDESDEESVEGGWDAVAEARARIGEDNDTDASDSDSEVSGGEENAPKVKRVRMALPGSAPSVSKSAQRKPRDLVTNIGADIKKAELSTAAQVWFDQTVFKGIDNLAEMDELDEGSDDEEEQSEEEAMEVDEPSRERVSPEPPSADEDDFEVAPAEPDDEISWDVEDEDQDEIKRQKIQKSGLITAEAVTLAQALVNRKITAGQMIDDGFNKHNFSHKDGLPTWFLDDENKHYKANLPVTKEAIAALRAKQRALDARPIKKVAEAKARKKFKAHQRLETAKRKAEGLVEAADTSEKDKAVQMQKILGKAAGKPKKKEVKLVVAKGANRGIKGRPKGVKGRYKIVDPRMRKEMRAEKRIDKSTKKRKH